MVKTTVYLDEADLRTLRAIAKRRAKPQAVLIREAVRAFTSKEPPPLPAGMGMFDSGHTDTTARRKEILREAARTGRWK
ncbi:MAG: ribbon-helix-helix domain-containing protein [Acidobacteriota bacterium]